MRAQKQRHLAVIAVALSILTAPIVTAGETHYFGRVTDADGAGQAGVVLALVTPDGETAYRSAPSADNGDFNIESAPAGDYRLVAETDGGAFLASESVSVAKGSNAPVALQLTPNYQSSNTTVGGTSWQRWGRWLVAGAIVVGAVFVIDELSDDVDEDAASPF